MSRRLVLAAFALVLAGLGARRAHALADPSELSVGGSTGAHDAHIACGPDVRVRHASGGLHYQRVFAQPDARQGSEPRGLSIDARAAVGAVTITAVSDTETDTRARALDANEKGRTHLLATGQVAAGWDWRTFALRGGVGYFSFADLGDGGTRFVPRRYPLPVLDMRIGRRTGFRGDLGVGAPPLPGLARWYSLYAILTYRFVEGGEVGIGHLTTFGGTLDRRSGLLFRGAFPITRSIHLGGFGVIEADDQTKLRGFNWTGGGAVTVLFDEAP